MSGPVSLPTILPAGPANPAGVVYGATATDALAPTYGAAVSDKILQAATATDALAPTYGASASDAPGS